ncbi:lysine-specific demethylase 5A-like isoform X1 [Limulus polyphemus]|uniref:[histone H3]-trimethyl-L-lysine(4) demethylase n=2 Tax=Limulus polyphemus TaxID=6850 RepID=A0ABM1S3V5_LIMPO|nr:lysine-specific demethylase 5A-like isoform X1 [Limulus polyphemus]
METMEWDFKPPPEAPVFEPTVEEFKDPLAYIAKIKSIAEKAGICKIKPPPEWQPPFTVDVDNFKFTPRVQRLNELEATTRIKLNFLDQIAKFWELQGSSLKIPNVERKLLDLYLLHHHVHHEGGMDVVTRERKWSKVAFRMGYPPGKSIGSLLRHHYERILYPYDVFKSGASVGKISFEDSREKDKKDTDYIPHGIPSRQAIKPPPEQVARRSKRHTKGTMPCSENAGDLDYSTNNELRKLQFYGAGPKMPGYNPSEGREHGFSLKFLASQYKLGKLKGNINPIDLIVCHVCGRGDAEANMLLCDGCDDSYHNFCLVPPLHEIPKGDWRCPRCVAEEVQKPQEAFGFEQAKKEYTLQEFGEMADQFKSDYFNMPPHLVPTSLVEKEFWRLVRAVNEDVCVEYGADIHTMEHGSGFPTKTNKCALPGEEEYINSGWNLNNLPILENSVLKHINADINGMKIPWVYVGMCFSTFCWHNEDHWSYSINYLHWGEPKTWYGVPGDKAEDFESAMKSAAPELFETQPDLLHQLVTIMNPNILMSSKVPIYRMDQQAGEFMLTFPRSYHAGFNQGYNFAEAVNFCPADWLSIGRECISHYSLLHRFCVFSHDELICKMAADPDSLEISIATATFQDMKEMVESEKELRKCLLEWGVTEADREAFELLADDERQCDFCKTTCFLSAVTCSCDSSKLVCINHKEKLCSCPPSKHCLRYRYTLDELRIMLQRLKVRAESFENWNVKVKNALHAPENEKLDITELKELVQEAEANKFPKMELLDALEDVVQDAEKFSTLAQQLLSRKVRTRNRQSLESKYGSRLTVEELQLFYEQIQKLPCGIKEGILIKDMVEQVIQFEKEAKELLDQEMPDFKKLERALDNGLVLDVDLPQVLQLKHKLVQTRWLEEMKSSLADPMEVTLDILRKLLDSGVNLPPHPSVEKAMAQLQELLTVGERWEEKAKVCLQAKPQQGLQVLEVMVNEACSIPLYLPNVLTLRDVVKKAKDWVADVESLQNANQYPYVEEFESLVAKARPLPVHLELLPQLESQVAAAKALRERTARTFLKKNSVFTLLEVLSPRNDVGSHFLHKNKKKKTKEGSSERDKEESYLFDTKLESSKDPAEIVAAFKLAEQKELKAMRELRNKNIKKRVEDTGDTRYCVCQRPLTNYMLQCELCKDWFHTTCVPLPKSVHTKKQQNFSSAAVVNVARDFKFLCPMCLRSRRPRLETILSLVMSLQKLPVKLTEGVALQCLTERAMSWQDCARHALATEELAAALAKLSVLSQKMVEQAAREKTEKIISSELIRAASKPELHSRLSSVVHSAFGGTSILSSNKLGSEQAASNETKFKLEEPVSTPPGAMLSSTIEEVLSVVTDQNEPVSGMEIQVPTACTQQYEKSGNKPQEDTASPYNNLEHAYSSASKGSTSSTPRKHARKSPLVPRQLEVPVLELSEGAKLQMEQLMMEGDLLEVSLDETQHIWRILQATKPARDPMTLGFFPDDENFESEAHGKPEKEKKIKKRKLEDGRAVEKSKVKDKLVKPKLLNSAGSSTEICKPKKKKLKINKDGKPLSSGTAMMSSNDKGNLSSSSSTSSSSNKSFGSPRRLKPFSKKPLKVKIEARERKESLLTIPKKDEDKSSKVEKTKPKLLKKKQNRKPLRKEGPQVRLAMGKGVKTENKAKDQDSPSEEDEDLCSATKCLKPTGEAVNWVQCDGGCEEWFHLYCMGLELKDVSETEDYICPGCIEMSAREAMVVSPIAIKVEVSDNECTSQCTDLLSLERQSPEESMNRIESKDGKEHSVTAHENEVSTRDNVSDLSSSVVPGQEFPSTQQLPPSLFADG